MQFNTLTLILFLFGMSANIACGDEGPKSLPDDAPRSIKTTHPNYEVIYPVENKPGLYTAATATLIDLRGIKPGTEFRHPHTGLIYVLSADPKAPLYPVRE